MISTNPPMHPSYEASTTAQAATHLCRSIEKAQELNFLLENVKARMVGLNARLFGISIPEGSKTEGMSPHSGEVEKLNNAIARSETSMQGIIDMLDILEQL